MKLVAWPVEAQPEGTLRATKDVLGSIVRTTVERNQPILQQDLVAAGAGLLPLMIPEGMRGMSVRVDNVTGVSGFITPNSHVDVIISGTVEGEPDQKSKVDNIDPKVTVHGKTATATYQSVTGPGMRTVLLVKEGSNWKISGLPTGGQ